MPTNLDKKEMLDFLHDYSGRELKIMEVCGTHTASIFQSGLRDILSPKIKLVSGPGCPVCVTSTAYIDECIRLSMQENTVLCSFGDMLKVKGEAGSLGEITANGGNIRLIYSPFELIDLATANEEQTFVLAAVGFETTTPSYALLLDEIISEDIKNIKLLTSIKSSITAIDWVLKEETSIDALLLPGHVAVIMGRDAFYPIFEKHKKPMVIGGFSPEYILKAIYALVNMLDSGEDKLENLYKEAVLEAGNEGARILVDKYFRACEADWRGLGRLVESGLTLRDEYASYGIVWADRGADTSLPSGCACGDIILGRKNPPECPLFGKSCTPGSAIGPCMVSSEGACGIWYRGVGRYGK
jgi:hydrogenase expression/formation protein HypD